MAYIDGGGSPESIHAIYRTTVNNAASRNTELIQVFYLFLFVSVLAGAGHKIGTKRE